VSLPAYSAPGESRGEKDLPDKRNRWKWPGDSVLLSIALPPKFQSDWRRHPIFSLNETYLSAEGGSHQRA